MVEEDEERYVSQYGPPIITVNFVISATPSTEFSTPSNEVESKTTPRTPFVFLVDRGIR